MLLLCLVASAGCRDRAPTTAPCLPTSPIALDGNWSTPVNLGSPVNTAGWEDSASISPDGRELHFAYCNYDYLTFVISGGRTRRATGPDRGSNSADVADIMVAELVDGRWTAPRPIGAVNIAFASNDGPCPLGEELYHSGLRNMNIGGPSCSDIYVSRRKGGDWSAPIRLGPPVNSAASEANPWVSADGNVMWFDSDRPGGQGGRDLWMSRRSAGEWGEPVNLGKAINGPLDDTQPFVTADGNTLYFAGSSRDGDGDHVIFRCRRDRAGNWSRPETLITNLVGEPTLTSDGNRMYFVHIRRVGNGYDADIWYTERRNSPGESAARMDARRAP